MSEKYKYLYVFKTLNSLRFLTFFSHCERFLTLRVMLGRIVTNSLSTRNDIKLIKPIGCRV